MFKYISPAHKTDNLHNYLCKLLFCREMVLLSCFTFISFAGHKLWSDEDRMEQNCGVRKYDWAVQCIPDITATCPSCATIEFPDRFVCNSE
jgi:hypothetical protein